MSQIRHILATTDFSPAAEPGIDAAIDLAKDMGARLTVVHVFDPSPLAPLATRGDVALDQIVGEQEVEEAILQELERVRSEKLSGLEGAEVALLTGHSAADAIDRYAKDDGVDLIVMSTHGRTGIAHFLIGSVTEKVLRRAPCPVLTVPSAGAGLRRTPDGE